MCVCVCVHPTECAGFILPEKEGDMVFHAPDKAKHPVESDQKNLEEFLVKTVIHRVLINSPLIRNTTAKTEGVTARYQHMSNLENTATKISTYEPTPSQKLNPIFH